MKKILTLFVMLLCGWSIVSAQAPVFGYQAVVRTSDNELVANTQVEVTVDVRNADVVLYRETKTGLATDNLGMLSILVGNGTTSPDYAATLTAVDWTLADNILATITVDGTAIEVVTPIYAAPYALQAASTNLTTEQLVTYFNDPETTIEDYKEIMDSLVNNVESNGALWQYIKHWYAQYLKDRKEKTVELVSYYLAHAEVSDVEELFNELSNNTEVKEAIVALAKARALANKDLAVEVLEAYLGEMNTDEVNAAYDAIMSHESQWYPYAVEIAKKHRTLVFNTIKYFLQTATETEINNALELFYTSGMKAAYVDYHFYNYLDSYVPSSSSTFTRIDIQNELNDRISTTGGLDDQYVKKTKCGDTEVDVCKIAHDVELLKNANH